MSNYLRFTPNFKKDPTISKYSNQTLLYKMRHEQNRALCKMYALHIVGNDDLKREAYFAALRGDVEKTFYSTSPPLIPRTERDRLLCRTFMKYDDLDLRKAVINLIDDTDTRNWCVKVMKQQYENTNRK